MTTTTAAPQAKLPKIIKRDGETIQDWTPHKIEKAVSMAFQDVGKTVNGDLSRIVNRVTEIVSQTGKDAVDVEDIQKAVKATLMEFRYVDVAEAYIIHANRRTEARKQRRGPDPKLIGDFVHLVKYSRYDETLGRREVFSESLARVKKQHETYYSDYLAKNPTLRQQVDWAFGLAAEKRVLPSMRTMQFGGSAVLQQHAKGYNCVFSVCNRPRFFAEAFHLSLCGAGVGFSVQWHHVDALPELGFIDTAKVVHHQVPDSIEGWAEALDRLVNSYYDGYYVEFAYHQVRAKGSPLKTSGGRAPGHLPLKDALENVRKVLDGAQGRQLKPIECYDIMCYANDAVYSGGVREAAMICLFSVDDGEMMNAKTGDWYSKHKQRARSNNSVVLPRSNTARAQYQRIFKATRQWGEPGFYFTNDVDTGANPCFSGDSMLLTQNGYRTMRQLWEDGGRHEYSVCKPACSYGEQKIINTNGVVTASNVFRTSSMSELFRVSLSDGRHIDATDNHTFFKVVGGKNVKCKLRDLRTGDVLPLCLVEAFGEHHDPEYAECAGWVIGDGAVCARKDGQQAAILRWRDGDIVDVMPNMLDTLKSVFARHNKSNRKLSAFEPFDGDTSGFGSMKRKDVWSNVLGRLLANDGIKPGQKHSVPESVWGGDEATVSSFIRSFFSADGGPEISNYSDSISIRATQNGEDRKDLLLGLQKLLGQFGITSSVRLARKPRKIFMNDGKGGKKEYNTKVAYRIIISGRSNCRTFVERIGFLQKRKTEKVVEWLSTHRGSGNSKSAIHSTAKIVEIAHVGHGETFCLSEPANHEVVVSGVVTSQCVEIGLNPKLTITPEIMVQLRKWCKKHTRELPSVKIGDVLWGWQCCNLTEVNAAACKTPNELHDAVKAAAIIGTLQAGYTTFPYLGWVSEFICQREALIGVSMTGMMDNPSVSLDPEVQRTAAQLVVQTNVEIAEMIDVRPAARTTCVKPAGSTSKIMGNVGSGIHTHHARRYFTRVRVDTHSPVFQHFQSVNPHMCVKLDDHKSYIIVPTVAPDTALTRHDLTALEFLEHVLSTQKNWVIPGTAKPNSSPGVTHNVSNTITVKPNEWDQVCDFLWDNRDFFSGVSFLADTGDKKYDHAPREEVVNEADEARWQLLLRDYKPVDWTKFHEGADNTSLIQEVACSGPGGACELAV